MTPHDLLPADLHQFLTQGASGLEIRHPFVRWCFLAPDPREDVAYALTEIEAKTRMYRERCAAGEWSAALVLVDRPFRLEYLESLIDQHGMQRLLSVIGHIWQDTENAFADGEIWEGIWARVRWRKDGKPRKTRHRVMTKAERALLASLPETLTIYRGFSGANGQHGFSWTLDRAQAEWFATRFGEEAPCIATATIARDQVLAYCGREDEIVVDPYDLDQLAIEELMTGPTQAELAQAHADWSKRRARQATLLRELEASHHPNDHQAALHLRAMIRADAAVAAMLATHL